MVGERVVKPELTEEQIADWMKRIDEMSHLDMASLWRFAPSGHPVFRSDLPLFAHFDKRFRSFGGFTPEISKAIERD